MKNIQCGHVRQKLCDLSLASVFIGISAGIRESGDRRRLERFGLLTRLAARGSSENILDTNVCLSNLESAFANGVFFAVKFRVLLCVMLSGRGRQTSETRTATVAPS